MTEIYSDNRKLLVEKLKQKDLLRVIRVYILKAKKNEKKRFTTYQA